jgi:SAM-dependent methyltransferase
MDIKDHFSQGAKTYDEASFIHEQSAISLIEAIKELVSPDSILDVGCGTGLMLQKLEPQFPKASLYGCDISSNMLTQTFLKLDSCTLIEKDALEVTLKVDLRVSHFSLHWMHPFKAYLKHFLSLSKYVALVVPIKGSFASWEELVGEKSNLLSLPLEEDFEEYASITLHKAIKEYPLSFDRPSDFASYLKNLGAHYSFSKKKTPLKRDLFDLAPFTTSYRVLELILKGEL